MFNFATQTGILDNTAFLRNTVQFCDTRAAIVPCSHIMLLILAFPGISRFTAVNEELAFCLQIQNANDDENLCNNELPVE